jgi:competence protein ComEC
VLGGTRALVRADGHRYEVRAPGGAGGHLRRALAGEVITVSGRTEARRDGDDWLRVRHVVGRIHADRVAVTGAGDPASRLANAFRRLLDRGAEPLEPTTRALFTGFVLGDDRFQDEVTTDAFKATGLTHLLAVSGSNVAFVMVAARPVLGRLGLRARFLGVAGTLALFALATRFEPSVLRATGMALVATLASTSGRLVTPLRALALAVAGLVLVDPFLVDALGFRLSVAASAGIIVLAERLERAVPGPRPLAGLVSVTVAAQAFVAPLLVTADGGVPLVSLPANVLAVPAAAPVTIWGLTGGLVAGVLGPPVAGILHGPTSMLLWWVRSVSTVCADLPLGRLGAGHLVALAAAVGCWVLTRRSPRRLAAVAAVVAVVAHGALSPPPRPGGPAVALGPGAQLWLGRAGTTVLVLDGRAQVGAVLGGLRPAGVRALDLVVVRTASPAAATAARLVGERVRAPAVLAPPGLALDDAVAVEAPVELAWGDLSVLVTPDGDGLRVDARPVGDPGVASPGAESAPRSRGPPHGGAGPRRPARAVAGPGPVRHPPPRRGHGHPQPHARLVLRPGPLLGLRRLPGQGR